FIAGYQYFGKRLTEPSVFPHVPPEHIFELFGLVLFVEQAVQRGDILPERVEDLASIVLVKRDKLRGLVLGPLDFGVLGNREAERKDATRRSAGDQVEHLGDPITGSSLDLGQDHRRNDSANSTAVDREDGE